jgi:peptidoglycan/xylan/chitin deacetylase (PgdA/CDA1 family)
MRLAAAAFGFATLACVAGVGYVLSKNVSVSVSAPSPEATTPGTKARTVAVRTVTEKADNRPLYPAYRPNVPEPAALNPPAAAFTPAPLAFSTSPTALTPAPAAPTTTGHSSNAVEPTAAEPATTAQPEAAPSPSAPIEASAAPAQPAEPAAEKSAPMMFVQNTAPAPAPAATPAPHAVNCPGNPNAIGVSRVVEIDTTGGPGFGFEHFKNYDFLREGEVVLTFDDGPWPRNTAAVLAALARHCTRAIFFPIGLHATYEPGILKQVAQAGHAVGSHTWSHQMLDKNKGRFKVAGKFEVREFDPKDEIEKGISAVQWAVGGPTAPFFRFPGLKHPPELVAYLGQRNFGIFSTDFDSFDFKIRKPDQLRQSVMAKLKKHGKGIALMHDFQHSTAEAISGLLDDLKAGGYKIVFMRPKFAAQSLPQYDEMIVKEMKLPGSDNARPMSNVIRTVE